MRNRRSPVCTVWLSCTETDTIVPDTFGATPTTGACSVASDVYGVRRSNSVCSASANRNSAKSTRPTGGYQRHFRESGCQRHFREVMMPHMLTPPPVHGETSPHFSQDGIVHG